jgi:hypothetical protein
VLQVALSCPTELLSGGKFRRMCSGAGVVHCEVATFGGPFWTEQRTLRNIAISTAALCYITEGSEREAGALFTGLRSSSLSTLIKHVLVVIALYSFIHSLSLSVIKLLSLSLGEQL